MHIIHIMRYFIGFPQEVYIYLPHTNIQTLVFIKNSRCCVFFFFISCMFCLLEYPKLLVKKTVTVHQKKNIFLWSTKKLFLAFRSETNCPYYSLWTYSWILHIVSKVESSLSFVKMESFSRQFVTWGRCHDIERLYTMFWNAFSVYYYYLEERKKVYFFLTCQYNTGEITCPIQ